MAGISESDIRDMMSEIVEKRFGPVIKPRIPWRSVAGQLGLKPCFTPGGEPESNGISDAFVNTLKGISVRVAPPRILRTGTSAAGRT